MGSGTVIAILLIVVVAGAFIVYGSGALMDKVNAFETYLQGLWGQIQNMNTNTSTGVIGINFHITYKDGTYDDINPNLTLSILPLSIEMNGKLVDDIKINIMAKMNVYVDSWSEYTNGTLNLYLKPDTTNPVVSAMVTAQSQKTGANWQSGTVQTLATCTVSGSTLDFSVQQYGAPAYGETTDWLLEMISSTTLKATISGKETDFPAAYAKATLSFTYLNDHVTTMSIVANPTNLNP